MIETILGIKKENNRKSCFVMALRSARHLTGRNVLTGEAEGIREMEVNVLMKDDVLSHRLEDELFFAGIAMYLIALDCLGCVFDNIEKASNKKGIGRALESFSSLDKAQIDALIDLRNTLAHNFGLATESRKSTGKPKKEQHKFILSFSDLADAVKLPETDWNGDFDRKEDKYSTVIGVSAICNLVETIISNVFDCYKSGYLKLRISDNEAKARFTVLGR